MSKNATVHRTGHRSRHQPSFGIKSRHRGPFDSVAAATSLRISAAGSRSPHRVQRRHVLGTPVDARNAPQAADSWDDNSPSFLGRSVRHRSVKCQASSSRFSVTDEHLSRGTRLADLHLSLSLKPFKCSSNGFVHGDFGSISQLTGRLGAVQVLTRRHHRNGTRRYFGNRTVQMLVLKSLPCRNQLGRGQRNLLGFGSPGNRSDLCHELMHGQILSTN